ncbi:bifunctional ADP-dependent (S)-NAD(P)H-hydrate dehydratase/NAD(P)H-hydrate epimerase [Helicobacter sp. 12S02634-8]|uniref:NAD(P)H-hydrate dehydratase n=1 Tax=Helicobacter sp. 12S02634-8 TaxID=1476199 RepID=UPI000BA66640|nr:NAD(P)H-hydrate dehydratase [Helicobacter sp. 12S02634-8]PAF47272.1 bifunctional ADP-dependent (S)-NAD(P)H-hydrate dehydratase/NAD(P)H-hydrate epimerase [Helicobacter sp. 12S02634-8]
MQNVYKNLEILDKRAIEKYLLSGEILMENAAAALHTLITKLSHRGSVVIIVCGGGDNGADGYALSRRLVGEFHTKLFIAKEPKSKMCLIQHQRAMEAQIEVVKKIYPCDIIIDCLFGTGLVGEVLSDYQKIITSMNRLGRIKIACDIPSGLFADGRASEVVFEADWTLSMGALKTAFFSDRAKECVGQVVVGDLGVSRELYEVSSNTHLLEKSDMHLPIRHRANVHKGDFGHLCVYAGEHSGAALLAGMAAYGFGAGLVSVLGEGFVKPIELMATQSIPKNVSAFALGMGMGAVPCDLDKMLACAPCVLDADLFYYEGIKGILESYENLVLTPHPKEFVSLLSLTGFAQIDVLELLNDKMEILRAFGMKYPHITTLLKGANTLISQNDKIYINHFGTPNLAKGGSGDVLAGLIGALLAQGYGGLKASITASLAHSFGARMEKSSYGLTPLKLIENIKNIV